MAEKFALSFTQPSSDPMSSFFFGREPEYQRLVQHYRDGGGAIVLTGSGGSGKTSLLHHHLAGVKTVRTPLLLDASEAGFSIDRVQAEMQFLHERNAMSDIVAIDNIDTIFSGRQVEQIAKIVLNYKTVRSLILVSRRIPDLNSFPVISLSALNAATSIALIQNLLEGSDIPISASDIAKHAQGNPLLLDLFVRTIRGKDFEEARRFLNGDLYSSDRDLIVAPDKLIQVAKPKLILTGETLAQRLKSSPQSVHELSSREYEILLAELLEGMGYEVELTPATRDGGKDIMAYMDSPHGRLLCLVEAKKFRADRPVGVSLVRELFGTFADSTATSAMLVTTSRFSKDAQNFQERHEYQLALRDYNHVVQWIENHK